MESLQYPIGKFAKPDHITQEHIQEWIGVIAIFPQQLKQAVNGLNDAQLNMPYRPGGWNIRQVVHHCADSHMNSFIRFKLALTEDQPVIKPYFEDRWAELPDSSSMPLNCSLELLDGLHARWVVLLKALSSDDLQKTFIHPEHQKSFRLDENIGIYAWHCRHHLAHILGLKERMQWV